MSTRIEMFQAQPFQTSWRRTLQLIEELEPPLNSTSNLTQNILRLKKAIAYVEGLILAADIDLVPIAVWQSFQSPCNNLVSQIQAFAKTPNESNITNANAQVDLLIQYLSPYVVTGKGAAQAAGRALSKNAIATKKYTDRLETEILGALTKTQQAEKEAKKILAKLEEAETKIETYKALLFSETEGTASIKGRIDALVVTLKASNDEVLEYRDKLLGKTANDANSIMSKIKDATSEIETSNEEASENLDEINRKLKELEKLHTEVFGEINDSDEVIGGLKNEYASLRENLVDYDKKQKSIHKAILDEATGLLPSTTGAGLASAYATQKSEYVRPIKIFTGVFYLSVSALFAIGVSTLFTWSGDSGLKFGWPNELTETLIAAFARIPLALPVVWLAYFSAKRRNENRRLLEEYAHKEAIARSFYSFQEQVNKLGDEDHKNLSAKLLEAAIHSVAFNASATLDKNHDDKLPNIDQMDNLQKITKAMKDLNSSN